MREIKEVLHYYLPYKVEMIFEKSARIITLSGLWQNENNNMIVSDVHQGQFLLKHWNFKPILHPLSSVNKDQFQNFDFVEIMELKEGLRNIQSMHFSVIEICLKNHIDIFGLIESGQAIEK